MAEEFLGLNPFEDEVGNSIKARLISFAAEAYENPNLDRISQAIKQSASLVSVTRDAIEDFLRGEIEVLVFRQSQGEEIPTLFIAGCMHALDVIEGHGSVVGG